MHARLRTAVLGAALALALLGGSPAANAAGSLRICDEPKYPGSGYFTSLTVVGVRCATGTRLVFAYYKCRVRAGGRKGRCSKPVLGYSCAEKRVSIPSEFDARVTCRRTGQRIVHTYQQNT